MNLVKLLKNYMNPNEYYELTYLIRNANDIPKSKVCRHLDFYLGSMGTDNFIKVITDRGICPTLFQLDPACSSRYCFSKGICFKCWQETLKERE